MDLAEVEQSAGAERMKVVHTATGSSRGNMENARLRARINVCAALFSTLVGVPLAQSATFMVTHTNDSGPGSLRQAITDANATPGLDTIAFNIPGAGPHVLEPSVNLPTVTDPAILDAYTQPGASANTASQGTNAVPQIVINHARAFIGLRIAAPNSVARGFVIYGGVIAIQLDVGADGSSIEGNFLGTDVSGMTKGPDPENQYGIVVQASNTRIGGTLPAARNLISGNNAAAIFIRGPDFSPIVAAGNHVEGNLIGTNASGAAPLQRTPNFAAYGGVRIEGGDNNTIGGAMPGAGNVIAFIPDRPFDRLSNGISITSAVPGSPATSHGVGNAILGNSIYANAGLGIDLVGDNIAINVMPNDPGDPDTGPNLLQNYPVLTSASVTAGNVSISGALNSAPNTIFRIEFFANAACDPSGFGEGQVFLGTASIATDGAGNAGFGPFSFPVPAGFTVITATATDGANNTSEFSQCLSAFGGAPLAAISVNDVSLPEGNAGTTPFVFTVTLSSPSSFTVLVNYTTSFFGSVRPASPNVDFASTSGMLTFAPGVTQQTITVAVVGDIVPEFDETFAVRLSAPVNATIVSAQGVGTIVTDDGVPTARPIPTLSMWSYLILTLGIGLSYVLARPRRRA